jgi:hypothetical protein
MDPQTVTLHNLLPGRGIYKDMIDIGVKVVILVGRSIPFTTQLNR